MSCRCGAPLIQEHDKMVCSHHCGYEREILKVVPTQAELLKENTELKAHIVTLEDILDDLGYSGSHRRYPQNAQNQQ